LIMPPSLYGWIRKEGKKELGFFLARVLSVFSLRVLLGGFRGNGDILASGFKRECAGCRFVRQFRFFFPWGRVQGFWLERPVRDTA